jgi:hypothetical protein
VLCPGLDNRPFAASAERVVSVAVAAVVAVQIKAQQE